VTLVAPPTLLPASTAPWDVQVSHDLDAVLGSLDVCYLLRMQRERMTEAHVPTLREYTACYGLSAERADRLPDGALIMHPGPMNRGVEIASEVADRPDAVITEQVANGVAVRMAVLFLLLGPGRAALPPLADALADATADPADVTASGPDDDVSGGGSDAGTPTPSTSGAST